jgi:hypothetical protein
MPSLEKAIAAGATHRGAGFLYEDFYYKEEGGRWHCFDGGRWHSSTYADRGPDARREIGIEPIPLELLMDEFIKKEMNNGK